MSNLAFADAHTYLCSWCEQPPSFYTTAREGEVATRQFPSLKPPPRAHSHCSALHEAVRSYRCPRCAHTFSKAYSQWQRHSTSQRDPHCCLGCSPSYSFVQEAKTQAQGSVISTTALCPCPPTTRSLYWFEGIPLHSPYLTHASCIFSHQISCSKDWRCISPWLWLSARSRRWMWTMCRTLAVSLIPPFLLHGHYRINVHSRSNLRIPFVRLISHRYAWIFVRGQGDATVWRCQYVPNICEQSVYLIYFSQSRRRRYRM